MSRGVQTLGAAGRSPVRKHCGREQHTSKSWSRRRGFLPREDRKKKLGSHSFIPSYIRSCSLCYLNPSQHSEWFKLVQQPPALCCVCWQKSKYDSMFLTILTIQCRRSWQQILISVRIFLFIRFKLSRQICGWEAHSWPTCSCFESLQVGFLQKQKTEMEILPKRFPPKLLNISRRFSFFFFLHNVQTENSFPAPEQHLRLAPLHSWQSAEKHLLPSMPFHQLFFFFPLIHKGALV